ncbi:hypothetical protein PsorP6_005878 [Peronosclerospora sorghi]|uniref:Uncharacterized protein n=1 Tax=Peronosclerospora sorghi TaxID=230839 RepID=A0ACC0W4V2_9STRA|nr:hypothetical protein PsorP6_005878 [Peronosclerospora sorghi]
MCEGAENTGTTMAKNCLLFCFAHQVNLLVKDVLSRIFGSVAEQDTAMINALSHSTSKWLLYLRACMAKVYGIHLGVYQIADTRCNSAQSAFASLLRVKSAMKVFVLSHKNDPKFPSVFLPAETEEFWQHLSNAEQTISPLTMASFVLRREDCTMTELLHMFGKIFQGFKLTDDQDLVDSVELCRDACEQPLYLLAYFLHPHFLLEAKNLPNTEFTSPHFLSDVAIFYYKRLIDEVYGLLRSQFFRWLQVTLISVAPDDFPTYHDYWEFLKAHPEGKYNSIATLALVILSISINSATCERLFREWGHIHTARRNRMNSQTTKNLGVVCAAARGKDRKEIIASRTGFQKKDMTTREQYISRIVDPSERERSRTNATFADVGVATESPVVIDHDGDDNRNDIADVEDVEEGFAGDDDEQLETATASARKVFTTWTDILQQVAEEQCDETVALCVRWTKKEQQEEQQQEDIQQLEEEEREESITMTLFKDHPSLSTMTLTTHRKVSSPVFEDVR